MHAAAVQGQVDVVQALVELGGETHAVNSDGWTPKTAAALQGQGEVVRLLDDLESEVVSEIEGHTPFHVSIQNSEVVNCGCWWSWEELLS